MTEKQDLKAVLGAKIRDIRSRRGLTGKRLAELSQISPAYLSEVERGGSEISSEKLARIAEALGVSVQELLSTKPISRENTDPVTIPAALSEAAEELGLSFSTTMRILDGAMSLTARRSTGASRDLTKEEWIKFYEQVKFMFPE